MPSFLNDVKSGLRSASSSYLIYLLPISAVFAVFLTGVFMSEAREAAIPILAALALLFTTIPAMVVTRGATNKLTRLKAWALASGDALVVVAASFFCVKVLLEASLSPVIETLLLSAGSGGLFLAICLLLLRCIRMASDAERQKLTSDLKLVWKISPSLLIRMFAGLIIPIVCVNLVGWIQASVQMGDQSLHVVFGLVTSAAVIIPASFIPFILLATGLKRAISADEDNS
jgi:hypothetical protein